MKTILMTVGCLLTLFTASPFAVLAGDSVCEGTWHTTNRKLDGTMTCAVTDLGAEKWRGRFYGVWQRVAFDYTVAFSAQPSDLRGTAQIDGADYFWKGKFSKDELRSFTGSFGGTRYEGYLDLKEKKTSFKGVSQVEPPKGTSSQRSGSSSDAN